MPGPVPVHAADQQVASAVVTWIAVTMIDVLAIMLTHSALSLKSPTRTLPRSVVSTMLRVVLALILGPRLHVG